MPSPLQLFSFFSPHSPIPLLLFLTSFLLFFSLPFILSSFFSPFLASFLLVPYIFLSFFVLLRVYILNCACKCVFHTLFIFSPIPRFFSPLPFFSFPLSSIFFFHLLYFYALFILNCAGKRICKLRRHGICCIWRQVSLPSIFPFKM
jgi:hypothetical protein